MVDTSAAGGAWPEGAGDDPRQWVAAVYDACASELYRYAALLLADPGAAEDAVQQAFMKLARRGPRAAAIESCAAYLRVAVRNECWRLIERRRRRPRLVELDSAAPLLEPTGRGDADPEERRQVEAALRALPPEQREVIHMKVYEEQTFQKIADTVGISINTAASRYRYGIHKLRALLGGADGAEVDARDPG